MTKQTRRTIFAALLASPAIAAFPRPAKDMTSVEIEDLDRASKSLGELSNHLYLSEESSKRFAKSLQAMVHRGKLYEIRLRDSNGSEVSDEVIVPQLDGTVDGLSNQG